MKDEIVEEIRRLREEYAAEFRYDIRAMAEDLRRRERESGRRYVTLVPRPGVSPAPIAGSRQLKL